MSRDSTSADRAGDTTRPAAAASSEGRRSRRKRELRERIYQVARELFLRSGFSAITVEQIAEAADIAPATFFNHFQNKQAVLIEMTSEVVSHLQQLLAEQFESDLSTRDRLLGFADRAAAEIEQTRGIARDVMLTFVGVRSRGGEPAPYLEQVYEPFAAMLEEGQRAGEVRDDRDAGFLAEMVVGMLNATIQGWLSDPEYPIEKQLRQAAEFAWDAVQMRPRTTDSSSR